MLQRNIMISGISGLDSRWLPPAYVMVLLLVFFTAAHNVNMAPGSAPLTPASLLASSAFRGICAFCGDAVHPRIEPSPRTDL